MKEGATIVNVVDKIVLKDYSQMEFLDHEASVREMVLEMLDPVRA